MNMETELFLVRSSLGYFAPLAAEITNEQKQNKIIESFLSVMYDTLAELRQLEQSKSEWINSTASLYRQERNRRINKKKENDEGKTTTN